MSKAFTRESDDAAGEGLPVSRSQLPPGTRNHITPGGAQKLRDRLAVMLEEKRERTSRLGVAAAADAELRRLETRTHQLQQTLQSVIVTQPPGGADRERVCFGAEVTVRHGDGEQEVCRVVGVEETDFDHGDISWLSPLARALLSRRVGETVRFHSPAGEDTLTILGIAYDAKPPLPE